MDDRLEERLSALQKGIPLEDILKGLDQREKELEPLLRLVASVRKLPHPAIDASRANVNRHRLVMVAQRQPRRAGSVSYTFYTFYTFFRNWLKRPLFPALVAVPVVACMLIVLLGGGLWAVGRNATTAVFQAVDGQVEVYTPNSSQGWHSVVSGERVRSGSNVRTHSSASTLLVFSDGSQAYLGPDTDLTLTALTGGLGKPLQIVLSQYSGRTSHIVQPARGGESHYLVETTSGTARVRGTAFSVVVDLGGLTRFAVDTGVVVVDNAGNEVTLSAGQATAALPGLAPEKPAYQFTLLNQVTAIEGQGWLIDGIPVQVPDAVRVHGNPQVGQNVLVEGRILADGNLVADRIELAAQGEPRQAFTGQVEAAIADAMTVAGKTVQVDSQTQVTPGLSSGKAVKVTFAVEANGSWKALNVQTLDEPTEATPEPTATPDLNAKPSLSFEPDELEATGCGSDFTFVGKLLNTGEEPKDYAANVLLGYTLIKGADFVEWVELVPAGWERIDAGQRVDFDVHVTLNAQWGSAPAGSELKLRVYIAQETNRPEHHRTRLTLTVVSNCNVTATPTATSTFTPTPSTSGTGTATFTPTPTISGTGTVTPTPSGTPSVETNCTGANPHPTGQRLAARYGVPYEEIMGWFCQHYGFGEIDLAYSLSREHNIPVTEVFALRASGMGWGQIKKALEEPEGTDNVPGHGKPNKKP
jgi:hypothetical protein